MPKRFPAPVGYLLACLGLVLTPIPALAQQPSSPIVLHAARLLQVDTGSVLQPGEVLVEGNRIRAVGTSVEHPAGAKIIDLGGATLMPGLIDAHIHLFLHPGAEDLQTVEESVPWRTILAEQAAKDDVMAGYTAERDMGTEGAGSADAAVRDAINKGIIPGPRLRISGNAIDILGGHEDANRYNPAQHVLSNADYANSAEQIIEVMREQHKEGSDFAKIYETGPDRMIGGVLHTPFQYTSAQLAAAVEEGKLLRNSPQLSKKVSAQERLLPCMPWVSRARSTRRRQASLPSITPRSSATRRSA
jgi:imidazolonepropionase-like amidohydrolase